MERKALLERLKEEYRRLLAITEEENWPEWDRAAGRVEGMAPVLSARMDAPLSQEELRLLQTVRKLDASVAERIREKRDRVRQELCRVNRGKGALKGYGRAGRGQKRPRLGISC